MWLWILIGLSIITKVHGYASGFFPQACESMSPEHEGEEGQFFAPQNTEPPFEVSYQHGRKGEPITVFLQSKQSTNFKGFMLEARGKGMVDKGRPVGKFIALESRTTRLLKCSGLADSAVSQRNNQKKTLIRVNWTAQGAELDITFRATFVQSRDIFWERVDVNVTTPPPPSSTTTSTTTSTTKPSTTTTTTEPSTTKPSTTTTTIKPSTTTSTTKPSTITTTTEPSITEPSTTKPSTITTTTEPSITEPSTTKPSTTTTTIKPSTTASTTKLSTTTTTTEPSITEPSITEPSTTKPSRTTTSITERAGTASMSFDGFLVAVKMELSNILTTALPNSPFSRRLNKVSNISCSLLCAAAEILAVILFCVGDSCKVTLIALVCVVIAINFIELVIVSLPIGPSHELKEICDLAVKVCSVIHEIFTIAVIFVGVLEIDDCRKNRKESWLLKVMVAYTAWIFLFVIWVFVFSTHRKAILGRSKIESSKNSERWRQQRKKKKLGAAEVIVIAVSVILIVGTMSFSVAVIVGIFGCQEK